MSSALFKMEPGAAAVRARVSAALGPVRGAALVEAMEHGPSGALDRTDVAQPALFATSAAVLASMALVSGGPLSAEAAKHINAWRAEAGCGAGFKPQCDARS